MITRTLLVGVLALGLAACASETDAPASETGDVSVAGSFEDAPAVPAGTYTIDASHSRAEFRVKHLGISTVTGRFDGVNGTVTVIDGLGSDLSRGQRSHDGCHQRLRVGVGRTHQKAVLAVVYYRAWLRHRAADMEHAAD